MPSEDPDESRPIILRPKEEFYAPTYSSLSAAPAINGITVAIDGSGADPAGVYDYIGDQWSGPHGGPANLVDSDLDGSTVANTETYSFGEYLSGSEDANDAKRVNLDVDTGTLDTRYLKNYEDDFEVHDPTDPTVDQPLTPRAWRFEPGSASAAVPGGYYYTDTPDGITSTRSFGCDFGSITAPDGSTIQSSTWALVQEFAVGAGGHDLTVSAYARPTADYASYDDGNTHADTETFVGADDAFVEIQAYDDSLQPLALDTTTQYSDTASEQHFAAGNTPSLSGSTWVQMEHTATLPADTAYVEVRLQAADAGDMWTTRGDTGSGHAAILFDDFQARYTAGLRRSGVLGHDHDTQYAPLSHASATDNPHDVTATQAGALADVSGSVSESNLGFDPATQSELDSHAGDTSNPHGVTAAQAGALAEDVSQINADITGEAGSVAGGNVTGSVAQADNSAALGGVSPDGYARELKDNEFSIQESAPGTEMVVLMPGITDNLISPPSSGVTGYVHVGGFRNFSGGVGQPILFTCHFTCRYDTNGNAYMDAHSAETVNTSLHSTEHSNGNFRVRYDFNFPHQYRGSVKINGVWQ